MILDVDKKGRILVPAEMRKELKLAQQVVAEKEEGFLVLKPLKEIEDPVDFLFSIKLKTKKTPLELKREAEKGLFGGS